MKFYAHFYNFIVRLLSKRFVEQVTVFFVCQIITQMVLYFLFCFFNEGKNTRSDYFVWNLDDNVMNFLN